MKKDNELLLLASQYEALYSEVSGNYADVKKRYEQHTVKEKVRLYLTTVVMVLFFVFFICILSTGDIISRIFVGVVLGLSTSFSCFAMFYGSSLRWYFPMSNEKVIKLLKDGISELTSICELVEDERRSLERWIAKYKQLQSIIIYSLYGECELCERLHDFHMKVKLKGESEWEKYEIASPCHYNNLVWVVARALEVQKIDHNKMALLEEFKASLGD